MPKIKTGISITEAIAIARQAGALIAAVMACVDGITPGEAARVAREAAELAQAVRAAVGE